MQTTDTNLNRSEIRKVFKRNIGSVARVSRTLGITHVTVSLWLKGKTTSRRVEAECRRVASELLEQEGTRDAA